MRQSKCNIAIYFNIKFAATTHIIFVHVAFGLKFKVKYEKKKN